MMVIVTSAGPAFRAPFTRRAWDEIRYTAVGLPLGIAGFGVTVAFLAFGVSYSVAYVGLPLLAAGSIAARWFGSVHRGLARRLLGVRIAEPPPLERGPGVFGWLRAQLTDIVAWRARGYLVLKFPLAVAGFVIVVGLWGTAVGYILAPIPWALGADFTTAGARQVTTHWVIRYGDFAFDTWPRMILLVVLGVAMLLLAPWALRAVLALDKQLMLGLLAPVSLAGRVRDLEHSRSQAVEDSDARLRQIERDLHDGAQAQIVAISMKLGLARKKLTGGEEGQPDVNRALELIETAQRTATDALTELRDLARGIHPPVLDSGLEAALASLAARSAVPVELVADVPERPSPVIESIAYFCAAELLANVAKHSGARHAVLEAVHVPGMLRLRVTDDGTGGARLDGGTGLRGLAERVRTVDGRLHLNSPHGGPTAVTVELPSHA
jgi:signal transduction histidine kinase